MSESPTNKTASTDLARRRFVQSVAGVAATLPLVGAAISRGSAAPLRAAAGLPARARGRGTPPEMIEIPEYMIYAQLPDGKLLGMMGALHDGHVVGRYSTDGGTAWGAITPLFPLDTSIGGWTLHNGFLDRDGELQLIFTNDANSTRRSFYDIHYDIWHVRSRDGRRAWQQPNLVWRGYAGSLLSFVQLRNGRIVLPFCYLTRRSWAERGTGFDQFTYMGRFSSTAAYSDDNGRTWRTSTSELCEPTAQIGDDGGIEPIILERQDGRVWMLIRTQNDRFFESYSKDGSEWGHPLPTAILSSDSPCSLTRLRDGRVVMLWNNTQRFPYANGGRAVLHGAVSEDDGLSWRGYREVAANPLAVEPPPPNGDHGVTYTVPALTADGKLVTTLSTGPGGGTYLLRVDPEWLYATAQTDDFSGGLRGWTSFGTHGVAAEPHPNHPDRQVLALRKPDSSWPAGATWNFPAGKRGVLRLRLQLRPGFAGALLGLTDHFSVPFDEQDRFWNVFNLDLQPGGKIAGGGTLQPAQWHALTLTWDCDQHQCRVHRDGRLVVVLPMKRETPGPSYLRLRSTAPNEDRNGMLVESVAVDVSSSWS